MPINFNRMKNLFAPNNQDFQQATTPIIPEIPQQVQQEQQQIQEPTNESLRRFLDMPMPERNNPNTFSKIGATLMSLKADPGTVDKALYAPYYRDVVDYKSKADDLLKGAQIESTANNYKSLSDYRNTQAATAQTRAATGQQNANTAAGKARVQADLALRPKSKLVVSPGQPTKLIDEQGRVLAEYPVGTISKEDEMQFLQDGRLEVVRAQGQNQLANTQLQGQNSLANIGANIQGQKEIKQTPGVGSGDESGNEHMARVKSRAQALIRVDPTYENFITFDPQGGVIIDKSLPAGARKMIQEYLDAGTVPSQSGETLAGMPPKQPGMGPSNAPVNSSPIGGRPDPVKPMSSHGNGLPPMQMMNSRGTGQIQLNEAGKVTVYKDGKQSQVSERNLQKAMADGWTVGQ